MLNRRKIKNSYTFFLTLVNRNMNVGCTRRLITTMQTLTKQPHGRRVIAVSRFALSSTLQRRDCHSKTRPVEPVKLAYSTYNATESAEDVPIVILHGMLGLRTNWHSIARAINERTNREVITVDARNHGESPSTSEISYELMAQDVVQLLSDLNHQKAILLGHSMGGSTAMYLALHFPELVAKLIVADMSPVRTSPSLAQLHKIFDTMLSVKFDDSLSLGQMRKSADEQLAETFRSKILRQFLLMNLTQSEAGKFTWKANLPVLRKYFVTKISTFPNVGSKVFTGPTLFIGGAESDYIPRSDHDAIKKLFPTAVFTYIEDANHWLHFDKPQEFMSILIDFINK